MRISYSHRFILLHVPRTGVSSVIAALDEGIFVRAPQTATNKLVSKYAWWLPWPVERTTFRVHETARHVRRLVPAETFERFDKIVFVRNPFSWLVSLYELVLQSPRHRHYGIVSSLGGFPSYVDWEIARRKRFQSPYVEDGRGRLLVDHIGRYERLAEDAARIFASIGVPIKPLPHVGRFTRRDYREFYDADTRRRVERHWARDLERFGYDFDGLTDPDVPVSLTRAGP